MNKLTIIFLSPWDGSFVRIAGRCVDPAFGAAASFNFLFLQVTDIIFELTVFNTGALQTLRLLGLPYLKEKCSPDSYTQWSATGMKI